MKKAIYMGSRDNIFRVYPEELREKLSAGLSFPLGDRVITGKADLAACGLRDVSYIFSTWGMLCLTEEEIGEYLPGLEAVFYAAGSVQEFARPFLARGVRVFSAWAANGVPVAEFTLAQIINASKGYFSRLHIPGSGSDPDEGRKRTVPGDFPGNYDISLGIIGAGMIGKAVIRKVRAVLEHIDIYVFDPFLPEETAAGLGVTKCGLQELFAKCDVISNHLANNEATKGILDASCFDRMKPCAVFINTGRGAQVAEADLIRALTEVPTRAAALDVTFPEPPVAGSPLYDMKNVFLTPHIAGSLGRELRRMGAYMYEEYCLLRDGKPTRYGVTLKMLETMA